MLRGARPRARMDVATKHMNQRSCTPALVGLEDGGASINSCRLAKHFFVTCCSSDVDISLLEGPTADAAAALLFGAAAAGLDVTRGAGDCCTSLLVVHVAGIVNGCAECVPR